MLQKKGINRRQFLRKVTGLATGAVAFPYFVPSSAPGKTAAVAPSNRITVGMIGMGRQAMFANLKPFLYSPDTQVVAVCDVDAWRLEKAYKAVEEYYAGHRNSGTFKGCLAYTDFREVLARDDIDAVMISTTDHWHVPIAIAAARAGKDIALEKPLTLSISEGRALCNAVHRYGCVFRTDSECRSYEFFRRQCELVLNGRIGKVHTIRVTVPFEPPPVPPQPTMPVPEELDYDMWLGPAPWSPYTEKRVHPRRSNDAYNSPEPGWMHIQDYSDSMITNWGTHLIDIAQWGNNTERTGPVEIEGHGEFPRNSLWDVLQRFDVRYRYANGVELFYTMGRPWVRFEGTDGWIEAQWWKYIDAHPKSILKSVIGQDEIHLPSLDEKADFIQAIKKRSETLEPAEVGHRTTSVCQLGLISCQLGQKLRWDPHTERFTNNDTANRMLNRPMRSPWHL